jgi:hypothetical protein
LLGALLGDASCDAHSDAQFPAKFVSIHPDLSVAVGRVLRVCRNLLCFPVAQFARRK